MDDEKYQKIGIVKKVLPSRKVEGKVGDYKASSFVMEIETSHGPKFIVFTSFQATAEIIEGLKENDKVLVKWRPESKLHPDDKFHNTHLAVWVQVLNH